MDKRYLSIAELAERFGISMNTARKLARDEIGILPIRGVMRVPVAGVEEFEKRHLQQEK